MKSSEKTCLALIGLGTVGTGVAKILLDNGDRTARHAGRTLWINQVVVRDLEKSRYVDLPEGLLTSDFQTVLDDPGVSIGVELIGGIEPARTMILKLMESGKDVVTANKALLAEHGPELFQRARELGRTIAFEASVAGGIPIIANLTQCLAANEITSIRAIVNGTCNYILSSMDDAGIDYSTALKEAQDRGFAEADPTMDVDGTDSAQKLAILAHLAFGSTAKWNQIPRRGINDIHADEIRYAKQLGYRIKLLACGDAGEDSVHLEVAPMLVRQGKPLAEVRENFNAVSVVGDAVGRVFYHGQGAGQMPTASAVVADIIDIATGRAAITLRNLNPWSGNSPPLPLARHHQSRPIRYYLRFSVPDRTGVLARIAGALGESNISVASVYQQDDDRDKDGYIPLIIVTHPTRSICVESAIDSIRAMSEGFIAVEQLKILD